MNTVPGPVNLHTRPSPDAKPEMMPPDATRSITYFVFQATRCPLSTMYFSPSTSCHDFISVLSLDRGSWLGVEPEAARKLTSFLMIAPKLVSHSRPVPLTL